MGGLSGFGCFLFSRLFFASLRPPNGRLVGRRSVGLANPRGSGFVNLCTLLCGRVRLATPNDLPYVCDMFASSHQNPDKDSLSTAATLAIIAGVSLVLAGTTALWVVYGDRVYFDTIMTGLASCFSF